MNHHAVNEELQSLIIEARRVSDDLGDTVERILRLGAEQPLSETEATTLLTRVVEALQVGADERHDLATLNRLNGDLETFVKQVIAARERLRPSARPRAQLRSVSLEKFDGIEVRAVRPTPVFHERPVAMYEGFIRTKDVQLWDQNARIDIHLAQFHRKHGRNPNSDELLDIMLSRMDLPGMSEVDQFDIVDLARSIAVNGVQKPPIIDTDGSLLDGNRRIAACYYIFHNDEFTDQEKKRAERILAWQLTDHATDDDREAVIVALNFEPSYKQEWPKYVRARKIYEEWQAMLAREPRANSRRQAAMKRDLSKKFALGPETSTVNLFIKMVDLATEFEDYHVGVKQRDAYEVKHRAERYFEYFDELGKGERNGVAAALANSDALKHLVYNLLYDGKFINWNKIRELKHIAQNDEALTHLQKAGDETDVEMGQEHVDEAISIAKLKRAETRQLGANTRIESFVTWLEELPVRAFRDQIKPHNLLRLHSALRLVEPHVAAVTGSDPLDIAPVQ